MFKLYHEQCLARLQQHVRYHRGQPAPIQHRVLSFKSACDGSILSSVPERTAGKNYWQVALRNLAQRRSESKLPLKTCVPWPNGGLDSGSASPP